MTLSDTFVSINLNTNVHSLNDIPNKIRGKTIIFNMDLFFRSQLYMRQKGKRGGGVIILTKTSMYFFSLLGIYPLCWANEVNRFFHATIRTIKLVLDLALKMINSS